MKRLLAALAIVTVSAMAAMAASDEGRIASIDRERMIITLDNGNSYRLPGEFNLEALEEGMEVLLAYDQVDGVRQVTDMDVMQ